MPLHIHTKTVLRNAFCAKPGTGSLDFAELRKFCNILYGTLVDEGYKYVHLEMGSAELQDYLDRDGSFATGIARVICVDAMDGGALARLNSHYPQDVQAALDNARKRFAALN